MSLGYVIDCLVRDELDIKYYVNLWENELKRIYYGGDYHTSSLDPKVTWHHRYMRHGRAASRQERWYSDALDVPWFVY